jgi:hypothetical protein
VHGSHTRLSSSRRRRILPRYSCRWLGQPPSRLYSKSSNAPQTSSILHCAEEVYPRYPLSSSPGCHLLAPEGNLACISCPPQEYQSLAATTKDLGRINTKRYPAKRGMHVLRVSTGLGANQSVPHGIPTVMNIVDLNYPQLWNDSFGTSLFVRD